MCPTGVVSYHEIVTINPNTASANIYGYTILIGAGIGCFQSAGVAVVSAIAPPSDVNHAVSIMTIGKWYTTPALERAL